MGPGPLFKLSPDPSVYPRALLERWWVVAVLCSCLIWLSTHGLTSWLDLGPALLLWTWMVITGPDLNPDLWTGFLA